MKRELKALIEMKAKNGEDLADIVENAVEVIREVMMEADRITYLPRLAEILSRLQPVSLPLVPTNPQQFEQLMHDIWSISYGRDVYRDWQDANAVAAQCLFPRVIRNIFFSAHEKGNIYMWSALEGIFILEDGSSVKIL